MINQKITLGKCLLNIFVGLIILYGAEILGFMISAGLDEITPMKPLVIILNSLFYITIAVSCFYFYTKKVSLSDWGLKQQKSVAQWFLLAIFFPILCSLTIFLFLNGKGNWEIAWQNEQQFLNRLLIILIDFGIAAGIVEELIFRGLIMKSIEWKLNKKMAIGISSILFTLLHIPGFSEGWLVFLLGFLYTLSISLFLSLLVYRSGGLIMSMLCHAMMNIVNFSFYYGETERARALFAFIPIENNEYLVLIVSHIVIITLCLLASIFAIALKKKNSQNREQWETNIIRTN